MIQACLIDHACHLFQAAAGLGAMTGPTIAGCSATTETLEIKFNASLLGGEGLMVRHQRDDATLSSLPACHLFGAAGPAAAAPKR